VSFGGSAPAGVDPAAAPQDGYLAGARAALPLVLPTLLIGASFGIAAQSIGWGSVAPVVMSIVVFSGAGQFAVASVLGAGGSVVAAVAAAALVSGRFLIMGLALAPSLRGGRVRRAFESQAMVDTSFVLARTGEGRFGAKRLLGATAPQFAGWVLGTLLGVLAGGAIDDPGRYGLDVLFPAFFLVLLWGELGDGAGRVTAGVAALLAIVLIPITPPGVPVIAACLAVAAGRWRA
jgi:4-azaleucine resistance transporter AzlC